MQECPSYHFRGHVILVFTGTIALQLVTRKDV